MPSIVFSNLSKLLRYYISSKKMSFPVVFFNFQNFGLICRILVTMDELKTFGVHTGKIKQTQTQNKNSTIVLLLTHQLLHQGLHEDCSEILFSYYCCIAIPTVCDSGSLTSFPGLSYFGFILQTCCLSRIKTVRLIFSTDVVCILLF